MRVTSAQNKRLGNNQLFPKTCLHCGAPYFTSHPQQTKWCGDSCRSLSYQKRKLQQQVVLNQLDTNENNYEQIETQETDMNNEVAQLISLTKENATLASQVQFKDLEIKQLNERLKSIDYLNSQISRLQKENEKLTATNRENSEAYAQAIQMEDEVETLKGLLQSKDKEQQVLTQRAQTGELHAITFQAKLQGRDKLSLEQVQAIIPTIKKADELSITLDGYKLTKAANSDNFKIIKK